MSKLCQNFQSPYKLSQASLLFHITHLPLSEFCHICDCGQISENTFFLNPLMQKIFFDKNHWFQLLSTKNDWPFHHVLFLLAKKQPLTFDENFIATPHQVTYLEKVLFFGLLSVFLSFFSFSFFGLLRPLLQIFKVWIIQTSAKCTNQITLSKKHMNYLFRP